MLRVGEEVPITTPTQVPLPALNLTIPNNMITITKRTRKVRIQFWWGDSGLLCKL